MPFAERRKRAVQHDIEIAIDSQSELKQILAEYRQQFEEILGDDLDSVILYGSQVCEVAVEGSDIEGYTGIKI